MPDSFASNDDVASFPIDHPRYRFHPVRPRTSLLSPRMSVNQITTYRWSFDEDIVNYRRAGVESVGVWRPKLDDFGTERAIELIRDSGIRVSSLSWVGGFTGQNGYPFEEAVAEARETLRLGARIEAECVVILSGARAGHTYNHARRLLVDALRRLADEAEELGVALAVQPMLEMFADQWSFIATIDETLSVLDECRHDAIKMAFDVYHLWREPDLMDRIREIAPRTKIVQLNDWHRAPCSPYDRALIGDGEIPLTEIVSAFLEGGYQGDFEISIWSEELWQSDYHTLLQRCQRRFEDLL